MDIGELSLPGGFDLLTSAPSAGGMGAVRDAKDAAEKFQSMLIYKFLCLGEDSASPDGEPVGLSGQGMEYLWMMLADDLAKHDALGLNRLIEGSVSRSARRGPSSGGDGEAATDPSGSGVEIEG